MPPLHCKACDSIYNCKDFKEMLCPQCKYIALGYWDDLDDSWEIVEPEIIETIETLGSDDRIAASESEII